MRMKTTLFLFLGVVLALAAVAAARTTRNAGSVPDKPKGHYEICIVSCGEVWSEIAPCG